MYQTLDLFQTAGEMARHAGARQAVVARNVANADTPGYQAQHLAAFADVYRADGAAQLTPATLRTTRPGHMGGHMSGDLAGQTAAATAARVTETPGDPSPNGNTVSIEEQMMQSIAVSREHSRALAIYQHTMTVLRNSLGRT